MGGGGGKWGGICYYITLHNSKQPIWERVQLVLFGSHGQIHNMGRGFDAVGFHSWK